MKKFTPEDKERAEKLQRQLGKALHKFRIKHNTKIECFPDGKRKGRTKYNKEIGTTWVVKCFQKDIAVCQVLCEKGPGGQCRYFEKKMYLCKEMGCDNRPVCEFLSEKKQRITCKKAHLWVQRKELEPLYEKYFLWHRIFRGFKIDPRKTLIWVDKNGPFEKKRAKKEDSPNEKGRRPTDKGRPKKKAVTKTNKVKRRRDKGR